MPPKSNKNRSSSGVGTKRPRSADRSRNPSSASLLVTGPPSAHTTQLSGATRNMRFMQRSQNGNNLNHDVRTRHSFPPGKGTATSAMDTSTVESSKITNEISAENQEKERMKHSNENMDRSIEVTRLESATPQDMYGRNQSLSLGRRSFGGFNPITAANWHAQQQFLDHQEKQKHPARSVNRTTPEALGRYRDLAKEARHDDAPSSTPRKKRGGKQGISNNRKRGLEDILQLD